MSTDPRIGTELAGYRIESLIGRGGMSIVYLAEQTFPRRKVALKVLSTDLAQDPKFRERFVRESNTAASMEHPNIIPIYGAGDADGLLYIAMRYIGGADLKKLIQTEGRLSPERTMGIMSQVASALDAAHAKGLVHRDVKPSNILLAPRSEEGTSDHAYLSDFGLTKRVMSDSGITGTGMFVGTLDYAAPEQFEGKQLDKRTDVYSLGCVLYECLTGDLPYARDQDAALMYAHLMSAPPKVTDKRPELPAGIDGVIAKAMAKSPDDRYSSAGQLVAAARAELGVPSGEHTMAARVGEGGRRKLGRAPKVGVALVVLVAVIVAFIAFKKGGTPSVTPTNPSSPSSSVPVVTPVSDRLVRIDEATKTVVATIPVGSRPGGVAVGEGSVWVTNSTDGTVSRIDPVTNTITATITVGKGPQGIAIGEGAVWVANRLSNSVSRIDPATNEAVATISVGNAPKAIAVGEGSVWAMSATGCPVAPILTISRVDPATNRFVKALEVGGCALVDGAVGEGSFWAVTDIGELTRFDLVTNAVAKTVHLNKDLAGITVGEGAIWVASSGFPGTVFRIGPVTYEVLATIPAGSNGDPLPRSAQSIGIVTDSGVVWVTDKNNGAVSRIAVAGNDVQPPIDVGNGITGIAVGLGAVWVTVDEP